MEVKFEVLGLPRGKERPRYSERLKRMYTPSKTIRYEQLVRLEYEVQCNHRFADDAMLCVDVELYYKIPSSTSKKKKALMLEGEIRPIVKPDWDNAGKIVCDALNKVAFYDDKQVVDGAVHKYYGDVPKAVVTIRDI